MAPDKHPEETRPSRHHMNHNAEGGKKHTPADWHQVRDLTRLVEHIIEDEELAREQEEYELLFNREGRRGRHHHHHHRVGPFPPCLRCALAGMHCSATQAGSEDDVRCRRCERNGERFCIRQVERVVGTLDPEALRGMLRKGGGGGGRAREVESMIYCLDPVLCGDRGRLLEMAADVLDGDGVKFVHGTRVNRVHAQNFALPMWHRNDKPENRSNPGYVMRTPKAYFKKVEVTRKDKQLKMKMEATEQEIPEAE